MNNGIEPVSFPHPDDDIVARVPQSWIKQKGRFYRYNPKPLKVGGVTYPRGTLLCITTMRIVPYGPVLMTWDGTLEFNNAWEEDEMEAMEELVTECQDGQIPS